MIIAEMMSDCRGDSQYQMEDNIMPNIFDMQEDKENFQPMSSYQPFDFHSNAYNNQSDLDDTKDLIQSYFQNYNLSKIPHSYDASRLYLNEIDQANPSQLTHLNYKTEICKKWLENKGQCPYNEKCRFAHGIEEVQSRLMVNGKYRSKPCFEFHKNLYCMYGFRCFFYHGEKNQRADGKSFS